jgi:predicted chitinase
MNIAKKMTFGSNWAPAMMGKMTGRKQSDIAHFTGARPSGVGRSAAVQDGDSENKPVNPIIESVKGIERIIKEREKQIAKWNKEDDKENKRENKVEQKRHEQILKALTLKRVPKKVGRPKKIEEPKKPGEPAKPAEKPATQKPAEKPATQKPAEKPATQKPAEKPAQKQQTDKAAKDKADREAKDKAAKDKADREAKDKADREAKDKAAKDKADREAKDKADREAKDKSQKEAKDKADKEAKDAKDKADRESKQAKDKADREAKDARDKADREAKQTKDKADKETATRQKKEEVKKEAEKPKEVKKEPEKVPKKEEAARPAKKQEKTATPVIPTGNVAKATLIAALAAEGYSQTAQANILANVKEESNFVPHSENIARYNPTNLFGLFGPAGQEFIGRHGSGKGQKLIANPKNEKGKSNTVRFNTIEDAEKLVSQGPEAVAEVIYGSRMGNKSPGDGYKYIGRGFIQLTGRENYEKVGKLIGVDLVNNPELANDPTIAAKIVPAFFKVGGKKPKDLEDIDKAIDAVGSASAKSRIERKKIAAEYQANGFGDQLNEASKENTQMRNELNKDTPTPTNVNNTTVNQSNQMPPSGTTRPDDRPAPVKKADKK